MAAYLITKGYAVTSPATPDSDAARHLGQIAMHVGFLSDLLGHGACLNATVVGRLRTAVRDMSLVLRDQERRDETAA